MFESITERIYEGIPKSILQRNPREISRQILELFPENISFRKKFKHAKISRISREIPGEIPGNISAEHYNGIPCCIPKNASGKKSCPNYLKNPSKNFGNLHESMESFQNVFFFFQKCLKFKRNIGANGGRYLCMSSSQKSGGIREGISRKIPGGLYGEISSRSPVDVPGRILEILEEYRRKSFTNSFKVS